MKNNEMRIVEDLMFGRINSFEEIEAAETAMAIQQVDNNLAAKVAIGAITGAYVLYTKVIEPKAVNRLLARYEKAMAKKQSKQQKDQFVNDILNEIKK